MNSRINLAIFLVKFVLVIWTFSFAISRAGAFQQNPRTIGRSRSPQHIMSAARENTKEFAPSQVVVDEATGDKWRLCAGVAVLNSKNQLLVGKRKSVFGSWQCPQGGVDDAWAPQNSSEPKLKETIVEAATRELYEETGLEVGIHRHVMLDSTFPAPDISSGTGCRYYTTGTHSWLTKSGFVGQEMHWVVFRCTDGRGDLDPNHMCDLTGKGGESAEFTEIQWRDVDKVMQDVWEGKQIPYSVLQSLLDTHIAKWQEQIESLDFSGKWSRDRSLCKGLVEGLEARGLTNEQAQAEANKPYIQLWERDEKDASSWHVTTYGDDGETPRRKLEYKPGMWQESYEGKAVLFGDTNEPIILKRQTSYVGEEDAHPTPIAQVTITTGPKGIEESRRYLKRGQMLLRRTHWSNSEESGTPAVSTEVFTR
jgi:8-oxo-dGTP pyrophosphatase MutT (NUDIX family)